MDFVIDNNILKGVARPSSIDRKLGRVILDTLNENPDHVAQIDANTGEQTTCAEIKDRSVRCAVWMKKLGIRAGDIVVAVTQNHLDSCVPVFATFFVDAVFNAWNHSVGLHSARRYMKKFAPKLIFACEKAADVLVEAASLENVKVQFVVFGKHSKARSFDEILSNQTKKDVDEFAVVNERSRDDVGAIMMSSGTTGFPKGVMLSDRAVAALSRTYEIGDNVKYLWYSTIDWLSCMCFMLQALLGNSTRIISNKIDVESFFQITEKYKVYFGFVPPILVNYIAKSDSIGSYDLQSLKLFIVGGCKQNRQVLEAVQQKIPTAFINNGYGWYRTGDIGYYNEDGEVFIVDRIKEIMKYRNYQISPAEIEEVLLSHPDVREAAVVAIPNELDGDWPAAFVSKLPDSRLTEDELMKHTAVFEDYKKLRGGIYFLDNLPRTGAGKIAKIEFRQLAEKLIVNKM